MIEKKHEIAQRLRRMADDADEISADMDYYGGLSTWSRHGAELRGAAHIARSWAREIDTGEDEESSD